MWRGILAGKKFTFGYRNDHIPKCADQGSVNGWTGDKLRLGSKVRSVSGLHVWNKRKVILSRQLTLDMTGGVSDVDEGF